MFHFGPRLIAPPLGVGEVRGPRESHHRLVIALDGFSDALMGNLPKFVGAGDDSVWTIWTCCVTCLGHLAALCHLVGQMDPTSRSSMGDLCNLALGRLGDLSREVRIEEYSQFDVLTGVRITVLFTWEGRY